MIACAIFVIIIIIIAMPPPPPFIFFFHPDFHCRRRDCNYALRRRRGGINTH